jgi:hypothetical protein
LSIKPLLTRYVTCDHTVRRSLVLLWFLVNLEVVGENATAITPCTLGNDEGV